MFEELKKRRREGGLRLKTIVAFFLFGVIILVFVLLDMNPGKRFNGGTTTGAAAALVNGNLISFADVEEIEENMAANPMFQYGGAQRQNLAARALDELVGLELVAQGAEGAGFVVSDREIAESIRTAPIFQEDGQFRRERYMNYLKNIRKTAGEFEARHRKALSRERAERIVSLALAPTPQELERQTAVRDMKANIEFVALAADQAVKPESFSAPAVAEFLKSEDGAKKVREQYEANKALEFSKPEEVNVRHILVRVPRGEAKAEETARGRIEAIRKRLEKEDFAKVAKDVSEDTSSKSKGGDLGFISRGRMPVEFDEAAFKLKAKELSSTVQTDEGFHIIQGVARREASTVPLEAAQDKIARRLLAAQASEKALDEVRELLKKGDRAAVEQWVSKSGQKWEEAGAFSVDTEIVPKIGMNAEIADLAFQLTAEKPLADRLVRQGDRAYIIRHKAVVAAKSPTEPEMKPDLMREILSQQRKRESFTRYVNSLRKTARIQYAPQFRAREDAQN